MGRLNVAQLTGALRARGLTVRVDPGAETRGESYLDAEVIVVHDDIIGGCPAAMPSVIRSGVQQPTQYVPGPLYNLWVACDGTVTIAATGVSNNAGKGGFAGYVGNSRTIGVCRSHHPDHGAAPAKQNDATAVVCAVLSQLQGIPASRCVGHKEWAEGRKSDPWNLDMAVFRRRVEENGVRPMSDQQRRKLESLAREAAEGRRMLRGRPIPMRGRDVRELQFALGLRQTGIYGVRTIRKVQSLQAWTKVGVALDGKPTGRVNRETWEVVMFFYFARAWGFVA